MAIDRPPIIRRTSKPDGYYAFARSEMVKYVPATARTILDVGCGEGLFARTLKQMVAGREVWGIELSPAAATIAQRHIDRVLIGDANSVLPSLPEAHFNCVVFNDVLEHMVDPETLLRSVERYLSRDGVVVCSIPNVRYFPVLLKLVLLKEWRYEESGVLDRTHLRFFTIRSIKRMFEDLDLNVLTIEGINRINSWKAVLASVLSLGLLSDCRNLQYACVVKPR